MLYGQWLKSLLLPVAHILKAMNLISERIVHAIIHLLVRLRELTIVRILATANTITLLYAIRVTLLTTDIVFMHASQNTQFCLWDEKGKVQVLTALMLEIWSCRARDTLWMDLSSANGAKCERDEIEHSSLFCFHHLIRNWKFYIHIVICWKLPAGSSHLSESLLKLRQGMRMSVRAAKC